MYSIKQASIRSGVSVPLIRAWERRYGVVSPKRTPSGYRLYDDEAIATLLRVRELTETGWSASEASRAVLAGEVPVPPVGADAPEPLSPAPLSDESARARRVTLVRRFLDAAESMDIAATGAALDEIFALGSFEAIVDDLLMPALAALGEACEPIEADTLLQFDQQQPGLALIQLQGQHLTVADRGAAHASGQPAGQHAQLGQAQARLLCQGVEQQPIADLQGIAKARRQVRGTAFMAVDARAWLPAKKERLTHFGAGLQGATQGIGAHRQG